MPTSRRGARSPALEQVALPSRPDLVHVSEYAYDAVHCFREPSTPGPGVWVAADHVTPNLHGRASRAATGHDRPGRPRGYDNTKFRVLVARLGFTAEIAARARRPRSRPASAG